MGGGGNGDESEAVGCLYTDQSEEGASYLLPTLPTLTPAQSRYWTFKAEIRIGFGLGTVYPVDVPRSWFSAWFCRSRQMLICELGTGRQDWPWMTRPGGQVEM